MPPMRAGSDDAPMIATEPGRNIGSSEATSMWSQASTSHTLRVDTPVEPLAPSLPPRAKRGVGGGAGGGGGGGGGAGGGGGGFWLPPPPHKPKQKPPPPPAPPPPFATRMGGGEPRARAVITKTTGRSAQPNVSSPPLPERLRVLF